MHWRVGFIWWTFDKRPRASVSALLACLLQGSLPVHNHLLCPVTVRDKLGELKGIGDGEGTAKIAAS